MDLAKEWAEYKEHQVRAEKSLKAWDKLKNELDDLDNIYAADESGRIYTYIKRVDVLKLINRALVEIKNC